RPIEAGVRVPLSLLALLVESEEAISGVVVLPVEDRRGLAVDVPQRLVDRQGVDVRAHVRRPSLRVSFPVRASVITWARSRATSLSGRLGGAKRYERTILTPLPAACSK